MALTTTTAILLGLGSAAGVGVSKALSGGVKQVSQPTPLPQPPSASDVAGKAEEAIRKKRAYMSQTVYSSPLGLSGEAQVARKTLLGQ